MTVFLNSRYHSTVMSDRAPEFIDPVSLSARGLSYQGDKPLSCMQRLCDSLSDCGGSARYELEFLQEGRLHVIHGRIKAKLVLQCQNCLEELILTVDSQLKLGAVRTLEEVSRLSDAYEPLLMQDRKIALKDIIEEELLLALPIIPKHEYCGIDRQDFTATDEKPNPFSILVDLKKDWR